MNTSPPAVTVVPPMFRAPVFATPLAVRSSYSPRGTLQTISPVFTLTALSSPHGGCWHGQNVEGCQNRAAGEIAGPRRTHRVPSAFFTSLKMPPRFCVLTYIYPSCGSYDAPPQFAPPRKLGNTTRSLAPYWA